MTRSSALGEFEQLVMLAILRNSRHPYAGAVRNELNALTGRSVSRGALYRTLDRLEDKGMIEWELEPSEVPERGGHPMRRLAVTPRGMDALRSSRALLLTMWGGLESLLDES